MATATRKPRRTVHQLKVSLRGSRPPIWRRLLVPSDITLLDLHGIVQLAMGWSDCHLHQFMVHDVVYGQDHGQDWGWGPRPKDESKARLARVAPVGTRLLYEYDFGDSWEHDIVVEKVLPAAEQETYPVCIAGRRACPPEDCGGLWGYAELLEAVHDPAHEQHQEMLDWLGGRFDPESFDRDRINNLLQRVRVARPGLTGQSLGS